MIPLSIQYNIDPIRTVHLERVSDNTFSISLVDDSGGRCIMILDTNQVLQLADTLGTIVYGDGRDE